MLWHFWFVGTNGIRPVKNWHHKSQSLLLGHPARTTILLEKSATYTKTGSDCVCVYIRAPSIPIFLSVPIIFLYFDEIPIFSCTIFTPKKCRDAHVATVVVCKNAYLVQRLMFIVNIKNWYVLDFWYFLQQLVSKQPFIVCLVHGASVFRLVDWHTLGRRLGSERR